MIYNGCKYLLQYGYVTDESHCEVCALNSNDIHIEEHHAVRSRYLERERNQERGMTMWNNDLVQIDWTENEYISDESNMIAGMSLDVDEDGLQLAAPVQGPLIPIDADYRCVQEASIESAITGRDSLLSGNELVVNQGNSAAAHAVRTNEGNTSVSGSEDIQAAQLVNAVNIGLLFSQMIQNQLQSALENQGYSVSVSSFPEIGASPDHPIDLSAPPPTELVPIAGTKPEAIHRPIFHANAPHNIHERLTGTKILPAAQQTTNMKPNARHALAGNISTTVSGSIQPGSSKGRLPPNNIVVSREYQLQDASIKPDTNRFSAEWPTVSSQQRPLNNESINHSQQRKATRNNSQVSSRTRRRNVTRKSSGKRGGSSMPLLNNHDRDRHGLAGTPSSGSEIAVDFSVRRNEQVMSEHLYARQEPMAAEISKRNMQLGRQTQNQYGSIRAIDSESQEVVMTPLARQLYTSGDPKSMVNPTTTASPPFGSLSGNILRGIIPCSTAAATIPQRQEPKARQMPAYRNMRSKEALPCTNPYKKQLQSARANHLDPTDEIVISPLLKKFHTPGNSVLISNTDSSAMPANGNVIVNVAPPATVTTDPAATPTAGAIVPWSASSTRTLSLNHRVNLHPDLTLPPFESIGSHLHSRGIKESRGPPSVSLHAPPAENINNIMEWLMLSSNNTDELPSPHPSLLSITSGDSGGSTVPDPPSIASIRDSGGLIGPSPLSITSGDSGRSTNPEPMSITSGISGDPILGPALLSVTSGDSAGFPWPTTSEDSGCPGVCEGPTSIMSTDSAGPIGQVPQNNYNDKQSSQREIQASVSTEISQLQNGVSKPRNRRKSTVPRKKRPKTLKQPTTNKGKVVKSPNPPSRKSIHHFIIVCGEEAFRVNSRVLEEASPVVRDFSKACLQAGSTGDCFFEVLGVTPWAMYELLKYVCRSSYNRTLMRSSSVKTLAEKLKIKISDGYPQQDSNDTSPANPQSSEDGFNIP